MMQRLWLMICVLLVATKTEPVSFAQVSASAPILFTRFASGEAFAAGALAGVLIQDERLVLEPGQTSGTWVSPPVDPAFGFKRLVASWNADTPGHSRLRVEVQTSTQAGQTSDWYVLGIWSADELSTRTSVNGQADALGKVDTDTLYARDSPFANYSLRVRLERSTDTDPSPSVRMLGAQVSDFDPSPPPATSAPLNAGEGIELPVPALSQEIHARQYPQWGGGGEAWCSPTSTEMVVEFWGRAPGPSDLAWVDPRYADPSVDFAARGTYDTGYHGTGNWPFNTAYAARYGLDAFVTQLRSLAEAEHFLRAGIPLVASIASGQGELDGFLLPGGTNGHLVVIVGFDSAGNPIVNDPAAVSNASVRRIYDRAQLERAWLRGSAGTVYVIHPPDIALPPPPSDTTPNW